MNEPIRSHGAGAARCSRCRIITRCGSEVRDYACWWCAAPLCYGCWDRHGHCGHAEADAVKRQIDISPYELRRSLLCVALGDPLSSLEPRVAGREVN